MTMEEKEAVIVDVRIPFGSMVWLLIKLALAAIPAGIVVGLVYVVIVGLLGGLVGGFFWHPHH
jgi:hypothetical protein